MSDEEHYFESKADVEASKTYNQQFVIICKNGYIVIKNHRCMVFEIKVGLDEGKDLVVSVVSAMGEEQIHAIKDYDQKSVSIFPED
ncbi:hypothetical protein RYX36_021219 [Vicia faba]